MHTARHQAQHSCLSVCGHRSSAGQDLGKAWREVMLASEVMSGAAAQAGAMMADVMGALCMQAVSAGVRPQLDRTEEAGPGALRAAVLSVAQQQKLAACTALLREVAMVYGFALHADPVVGEAVAGTPPPARAAEGREEQPSTDILDPARAGSTNTSRDAVLRKQSRSLEGGQIAVK